MKFWNSLSWAGLACIGLGVVSSLLKLGPLPTLFMPVGVSILWYVNQAAPTSTNSVVVAEPQAGPSAGAY